MERLYSRKRNTLLALALSTTALAGCSVELDSYLNDPSGVQCDGRRTKAELAGDGMATFIVHGVVEGSVATVQVRRSDNNVSVSVTGDEGFTAPIPIVDGAELSAFGAGGAWVIDAREDSVVIQGSCDGL